MGLSQTDAAEILHRSRLQSVTCLIFSHTTKIMNVNNVRSSMRLYYHSQIQAWALNSLSGCCFDELRNQKGILITIIFPWLHIRNTICGHKIWSC